MGQLPTVVYIAGAGRSGSTLLANVLGEVEHVGDVGELRFLWQRGVIEQRRCGCGVPTPHCEVWGPVLASLGAQDPAVARRHAGELWAATRIRTLSGPSGGFAEPGATSDELITHLAKTYEEVATRLGVDVLVDSSKLPTYARLVERIPGIDLRIVHLVRDPRAVAASWARAKVQLDNDSMMERRGVLKTVALWRLWNEASMRWWREDERAQLVRYEDFAADPAAIVRRLVARLPGGPRQGPVFPDPSSVELSAHHGVSGNPDRYTTGAVRVRPDERWRSELDRGTAEFVMRLAGVTATRLGYGGKADAR